MLPIGDEKGLDFGASAPAQPPGRDAAEDAYRSFLAHPERGDGLVLGSYQAGYAAGAAAQAERVRVLEAALQEIERYGSVGPHPLPGDKGATWYRLVLEISRVARFALNAAPCRLCAEAGPHAHADGEAG